MTLHELVEAELKQRQELKNKVMEVVFQKYQIGNGKVMRGALQQYVYEQLGFHGKPGNHFHRFINGLMTDNGFRVSFSRGARCYYGVIERACDLKIILDKPSIN